MASLKGNYCVVTGAAGTGIGFETSLELAKRGCTTILGCRGDKCNTAATRIRRTCQDCKVHAFQLDVTSPRSVESFAKSVSRVSKGLNVLVNNAGRATWNILGERQLLHGLDATLVTNAIGPFLVTKDFLPQLSRGARRSGKNSVVFTVASGAHRYGKLNFMRRLAVPPNTKPSISCGILDYGDSKLANILFAKELARQAPAKVLSMSYNPSLVRTELFRSSFVFNSITTRMPKIRKPAEPATEIADWVCEAQKRDDLNGVYVSKKNLGDMTSAARDEDALGEFWKVAEGVRSWLHTKGV